MKKIIYSLLVFALAMMMNIQGANAEQKGVIGELIRHLEVGRPLYHENLTIIPIYTKKVMDRTHYTLLDEALEKGWLEITELEAGHVPQVRLTNHSHKYIFIMGGEVLTGCKQDRLIKRDVLIRPKASNVVVPVYCVEEGRWHQQSAKFHSKKNLATYNLRAEAQHEKGGGQGKIWKEISQMARANMVSSPTGAYQEIYEKTEVKNKIASYNRKMENIPQLHKDTIGVVIGVGGRIVAVELFANPYLFERLWPKLLKSCALSAISTELSGSITQREAIEFLRSLADREYKKNPAIDLGFELSLVDDKVNVNALVYEGAVIHLAGFPQEAKEGVKEREPAAQERIPVMQNQEEQRTNSGRGTRGLALPFWLKRLKECVNLKKDGK